MKRGHINAQRIVADATPTAYSQPFTVGKRNNFETYTQKARCEQRAFESKIEEGLALNNLDEVLDLEDHATDGRRISLLNRAADFAKAQSLQGFALVGRTADLGANLGDVKSLRFSHDYASFFSDQP